MKDKTTTTTKPLPVKLKQDNQQEAPEKPKPRDCISVSFLKDYMDDELGSNKSQEDSKWFNANILELNRRKASS